MRAVFSKNPRSNSSDTQYHTQPCTLCRVCTVCGITLFTSHNRLLGISQRKLHKNANDAHSCSVPVCVCLCIPMAYKQIVCFELSCKAVNKSSQQLSGLPDSH